MALLAKEQRWRYCCLTAFLILLGLWALTSPVALAQEASATVNGVVSDPTGAAIPNAQVNLTNVNTTVVRSTKANTDGAYAFLNVLPGVYMLQASAAGFASVTQSAVTLEVNQTATFDFHLKVGETQTSVTVEATAAAVESSTSELGTVVANQEVVDLPLNGRNFTQLLTITPGVVNIHTDQSAGGGGLFVGNALGEFSFPSINGSRVRSNDFLLDGVNNLNTFLSMYNYQPIVDDIQEFKTQGHNDLAEYGGVTGGIVSVVSKSGTNQYHGTLWEFLRNQDLDARGFFNAATPPLKQNQFGAAAGGPIWIPKVYNGKNRTFFYAAYEAYRQRVFSEGGVLGPTDAQRAGNFSADTAILYDPNSTTYNAATNTYSRNPIPGNIIPQNELNPISLAYQKLVPEVGPMINGSNIYIPTPAATNQDEGSVRADQYFGNSDQLMFRYSQYEQMVSTGAPMGPTNNDIYGYNYTVHETHTFGPTAVVDAYFARNFGNDWQTTSTPGEDAAFISNIASLGMSPDFMTLAGKTYAPSMSITNVANSSTGAYISWPYGHFSGTGISNVWQYGGTFAKIIGKHTVKAGVDFETNNFHSPIGYDNESFEANQTAGLGAQGGLGGDAWASFLMGVPYNAAIRSINEVDHGGWNDAFFVQDQWKATPRLTINVGFRNEMKLQPIYGSGKDLYSGDADAVTGQYILTAQPPNCSATVTWPCLPNGIYAGQNGIDPYPDPYTGLPPHVIVEPNANHRILSNSLFNWAGRVGLAFRLNDKTVIRSGYGRFYDMWGAVVQLSQNFGGNWPSLATINNPNLNIDAITAPMSDPLHLGAGAYPPATIDQVSQWMVDPQFKTPYMDQWNFGIQRELPSDSVLDVNYVGSVGRRLDWGPEQNVPTPGPGNPTDRQPYPYMLPQWFDQSVGNSRYDALQVSYNKRPTHGLAFLLGYTLSHSTDDGCSADIGADCDVQNVLDRGQDIKTSTFNETSVFTASFTLQSPFGKPGSSGNKVLGYLAGGWSLNGIMALGTGFPYTVTTSNAISNVGANEERPNLVGNPNSCCDTVQEWFNTAAYANPAPYTYGNSKADTLVANWQKNLDISLFRQFRVGLGETRYFEFRAEAFNVLNNVVFTAPDSGMTDPNYGKVLGQLNTPRQLQLGLKFYF
jgi:hypothetical protein